jgi:hypothetical protein
VEFYMVPDNATLVQARLDEIRAKMPKFVCLNDDMNKTADPPAETLQALRDFYHSYFPVACPFENEPGRPNDFLYIDEWRERKQAGALSWSSWKDKWRQWNEPAPGSAAAPTAASAGVMDGGDAGPVPRWLLWLLLLGSLSGLLWITLPATPC